MSELKLLPCPFCGGEAAPYHVDQCEDEGEPAAFVMCNLCNAQVPWSPDLEPYSHGTAAPRPIRRLWRGRSMRKWISSKRTRGTKQWRDLRNTG